MMVRKRHFSSNHKILGSNASWISSWFLVIAIIICFDMVQPSEGFVSVKSRLMVKESKLQSMTKLWQPNHKMLITQQKQRQGSLQMSTSTVAASLCLALSTTVGCRFKSNIFSLMMAAIMSNLLLPGIIPTSHALYDACWTIFLPASLAITLLTPSKKIDNRIDNPTGQGDAIKWVGLAFVIASIGSIFGCITSYQLLPRLKGSDILSGCLCASYIGGTVNFFAAARLLAPNDKDMASVVTSMATADVILMAMYFTILSWATECETLKKKFHYNLSSETNETKNGAIEQMISKQKSETEMKRKNRSQTQEESNGTWNDIIISGFQAIAVSSCLVSSSNFLEAMVYQWTRIPGTACAIIALGATLLRRFLTVPKKSSGLKTYSFLSSLGLHLMFAAIGATANIRTAVIQYGTYSLSFGSLALLVHMLFALLGSFFVQLFLQKRSQLSLQHIIIASNAAIGGSATAAAFASSNTKDDNEKRTLVLAATIWGVVGYGIGTSIGVWLTNWLKILS